MEIMDLVNGLDYQTVVKLRKRWGLNEIEDKRALGWGKLLADQFKSPLIYVLAGAGIISLILKEITDALVIMAAVAVNTGLGFFQEFKAEKSLEALKKMIVPHAKVKRDGKVRIIEAKNIVPGDLVMLKMGDKVPADGLLVEAKDLYVNEAMLTGESEAVTKRKTGQKILAKIAKGKRVVWEKQKEKTMVFMGTVVTNGKGVMWTTKTGMRTRMGSLAGQLKGIEEEETPLRKKIGQMARWLTVVLAGVCLLIFVEGVVMQREILEMLNLSVAVAVASIPEGLAVGISVILTLGMQRILKKKGLVRKLLAAETLGSVDLICIDKTGTLTEGKMRVVKAEIKDKKQTARELICCNPLINSVDAALEEWGAELAGWKSGSKCKEAKVDEVPFNSTNKLTAVWCQRNETEGAIYIYGAPENLVEMAVVGQRSKNRQTRKIDGLTQKGWRVIGVAREEGRMERLIKKWEIIKKALEEGEKIDKRQVKLSWLGLIGLEDPVRGEVKESLKTAKRAGIKVKVITGDYENTALKVLYKLGLAGKIKRENLLSGEELRQMGDEELVVKIEKIILFYRTTPEQKTRIVTALQNKGHAVAMMGDGVNDALALKKADIGVVVGEATEVAKETADMVLLDSNFATILTAIKEGRVIFENIRKIILYLLSGSFSEVIMVGGALIAGLPMPFLAVQILWINIVEDSLPGLALAFEKDGDNLMKEKPRKRKEAIVDKRMRLMIGVIALSTDLILLGLFAWLVKSGVKLELVRTIILAILGLDSLLFVFSCKSISKNIWQIKVGSNKYLNWSLIIGTGLLLAGIYAPGISEILGTVPIPAGMWVGVGGMAALDVVLIEAMKVVIRRQKLHQ